MLCTGPDEDDPLTFTSENQHPTIQGGESEDLPCEPLPIINGVIIKEDIMSLNERESKWGFTLSELQACSKVASILFSTPSLYVGDPYLAESRLYTMITRDRKTKRENAGTMKAILAEEKQRRERAKRAQDLATIKKTTMRIERDESLNMLLLPPKDDGSDGPMLLIGAPPVNSNGCNNDAHYKKLRVEGSTVSDTTSSTVVHSSNGNICIDDAQSVCQTTFSLQHKRCLSAIELLGIIYNCEGILPYVTVANESSSVPSPNGQCDNTQENSRNVCVSLTGPPQTMTSSPGVPNGIRCKTVKMTAEEVQNWRCYVGALLNRIWPQIQYTTQMVNCFPIGQAILSESTASKCVRSNDKMIQVCSTEFERRLLFASQLIISIARICMCTMSSKDTISDGASNHSSSEYTLLSSIDLHYRFMPSYWSQSPINITSEDTGDFESISCVVTSPGLLYGIRREEMVPSVNNSNPTTTTNECDDVVVPFPQTNTTFASNWSSSGDSSARASASCSLLSVFWRHCCGSSLSGPCPSTASVGVSSSYLYYALVDVAINIIDDGSQAPLLVRLRNKLVKREVNSAMEDKNTKNILGYLSCIVQQCNEVLTDSDNHLFSKGIRTLTVIRVCAEEVSALVKYIDETSSVSNEKNVSDLVNLCERCCAGLLALLEELVNYHSKDLQEKYQRAKVDICKEHTVCNSKNGHLYSEYENICPKEVISEQEKNCDSPAALAIVNIGDEDELHPNISLFSQKGLRYLTDVVLCFISVPLYGCVGVSGTNQCAELLNGLKIRYPNGPPKAELDGLVPKEEGFFEEDEYQLPYQDVMLYAKPYFSTNSDASERSSDNTISALTRDTSEKLKMNRTQKCHTCKGKYNFLHPFYYSLCRPCGEYNYNKRLITRDLNGKVVLLTGCRIKIGYAMCISLLRCGATVIGTSRFVIDAIGRFSGEPDYESWKHRLHLYTLDMRDMWLVTEFCAYISSKFPKLFAIINNAAQTIARTPAYTADLRRLEVNPPSRLEVKLKEDSSAYEWHQYFRDNCSVVVGRRLTLGNEHKVIEDPIVEGDFDENNNGDDNQVSATNKWAATNVPMTHLTEEKLADVLAKRHDRYDTFAEESDIREKNSWSMEMHEINGSEAAEVMAINALSPFIINSKLKHLLCNRENEHEETTEEEDAEKKQLEASLSDTQRRKRLNATTTKNEKLYCRDYARFIINVSAMEGQFYRHKQTTHPHTNMAKAALNMMTRTSAEDYARYGIYMNSVDTGWITDESPADKKQRRANEEMLCPLDEVDAAARCLDLIYSDCREYGKFWKNFTTIPW